MNKQLNSLIDHIFSNEAAKRDVVTDKATVYHPGGGDASLFAFWRKTYSDHFPLSFQLKVRADEDRDFFR